MGGVKIPRIFGRGTRIPYSQEGAKYPKGVHNILGYMEWGCQISWDAKYTVIPVSVGSRYTAVFEDKGL